MSYRHHALRAPLGFFVLVGVGLLGQPQSATAADLDYGYSQMPQVPQQMVTFGSGWYVRGDLAATELPTATVSTPALGDAPTMGFNGKHSLGFDASLGGGYAFTNSIRADITGDLVEPIHTTASGASFACQNGYGPVETITSGTTTTTTSSPTYGTCTGAFAVRLNSYDVLVNGYYDLGTFYGVTPYVGAGVGLSFGHYQTSAAYTQADGTSYNINVTNPASGQTFHIDEDRTSSGSYYTLAWALMAGLSIDVYSHTKLDVGYRYLDLGTILGQHYTAQQGRIGLRYMIDN